MFYSQKYFSGSCLQDPVLMNSAKTADLNGDSVLQTYNKFVCA